LHSTAEWSILGWLCGARASQSMAGEIDPVRVVDDAIEDERHATGVRNDLRSHRPENLEPSEPAVVLTATATTAAPAGSQGRAAHCPAGFQCCKLAEAQGDIVIRRPPGGAGRGAGGAPCEPLRARRYAK
jgi:hypothetical protein